MVMTQDAYLKMMGTRKIPPRIDRNDPMSFANIKKQIEAESGGMQTATLFSETQGMGIRPEALDPGGYGYVVTQTEKARRLNDPNSAEFKARQQQERQKRADEEMKQYWEKRKMAGVNQR